VPLALRAEENAAVFFVSRDFGTRFEEALFSSRDAARRRCGFRKRAACEGAGRRTLRYGSVASSSRSTASTCLRVGSAGAGQGGSGRARGVGRRAHLKRGRGCQRQDAQTGLARTWTPATARPGSTRETCRSPRARRTRAPAAAGRQPRADPRASSPRASCCGADNKRTHPISVD
jgi:hypothetical protein